MMDGLERRFAQTWPVIFLVLTDGPETSNNSPDLFNRVRLLNGVMVHAVRIASSRAGGRLPDAPILTQNTGGLSER